MPFLFEKQSIAYATNYGTVLSYSYAKIFFSTKTFGCRYWKLSLLVHPDKCTHPRAHEAFTALNKAFKDLQDPVQVS
jgi:hypothetical protein